MDFKLKFGYFVVVCSCAMFFSSAAPAFEKGLDPAHYLFQADLPWKKGFDDKSDLFITMPFKDFVPPEIWEKLVFNQEEMKKGTAELLGFTAPELVGKISPEIKPRKYTYKDLEQYPGLKALFPPLYAEHVIKPGSPPLVGNIPEFEIIPTRQFYYYTPLIEATKRNLGKTKLDKDGYLVPGSWNGGVPFPRPSGEHKAQQVFYNFEKRSLTFDECWGFPGSAYGFDKNHKIDSIKAMDVSKIRWKARLLFPPYGWYDKRAEKNNEFLSYSYIMHEPRSQRGLILMRYLYDDPNKPDSSMVYVPSLRRIRKLTSTDTQDPTGDMTYDDQNMFLGKVTPDKYPYKFDIIGEREYLLSYCYGNNMPAWCASRNGYALGDVKFMRRPVYVLQMTQLDPNYVYSKRVYYIDKEIFDCTYGEYYDQRGRLYRSQYYTSYTFMPECGMAICHGALGIQRDHIDQHSTLAVISSPPAPWTRLRFSIQEMIKRGK